jgi:uncharacterized protein (TIGR03067 family)
MRRLLASTLLLLVSCGCSSDRSAGVARTDAEKLEGTWLATRVETDGKQAPADFTARIQMKFQGGMLMIRGLLGDNRELPCQLKLDPEKTPRTIDWSGLGTSETVLGIYELDGDRLRLCIITRPRERPTEFKTEPGSNLTCLELKRSAR